mgnify:CR=1 FL=1
MRRSIQPNLLYKTVAVIVLTVHSGQWIIYHVYVYVYVCLPMSQYITQTSVSFALPFLSLIACGSIKNSNCTTEENARTIQTILTNSPSTNHPVRQLLAYLKRHVGGWWRAGHLGEDVKLSRFLERRSELQRQSAATSSFQPATVSPSRFWWT